MIDGAIVIESPQAAIVAGRWAKVPIIIGANSMDIGFPRGKTMDELFAPFGSNEEKAKALYNPDHSDNVMLVGMHIAADQMMVEPARFVSRTVSSQGIPRTNIASPTWPNRCVTNSPARRMQRKFPTSSIPSTSCIRTS